MVNNKKLNQIKGLNGALIVLFGFYIIAKLFHTLFYINLIPYYWLTFTILTGIWEYYYVTNRNLVINKSEYLLSTNTHVWNTYYDINMILPHNTAYIFYSEYGAYADREYMSNKDKWSIMIEGSHALFCAFFAFLALFFNYLENDKNFYISISISMASQCMNSILYMGEYFIQTKTPSSINYNSDKFPCGNYLINRPFMYINIFWTVMPIYILASYLI